jgi:hypothetical protein
MAGVWTRYRRSLRYTHGVSTTTILWPPVGQRELEPIADSGWTRFPPRLVGQPIFYPVLNEEHATKIARDWNTQDPASGFVGHALRLESGGHRANGSHRLRRDPFSTDSRLGTVPACSVIAVLRGQVRCL